MKMKKRHLKSFIFYVDKNNSNDIYKQMNMAENELTS